MRDLRLLDLRQDLGLCLLRDLDLLRDLLVDRDLEVPEDEVDVDLPRLLECLENDRLGDLDDLLHNSVSHVVG